MFEKDRLGRQNMRVRWRLYKPAIVIAFYALLLGALGYGFWHFLHHPQLRHHVTETKEERTQPQPARAAKVVSSPAQETKKKSSSTKEVLSARKMAADKHPQKNREAGTKTEKHPHVRHDLHRHHPQKYVRKRLARKRPSATLWRRWGIAPYASSLAALCKKAPQAIAQTSMPEEVKKHFVRALGSTCTGGTPVWLTPDTRLVQMWSGGPRPHLMDDVKVAKLPVLHSPSGRAYRRGTVALTARALEWNYTYQEKKYLLDVPLVCFNLSWRLGPRPPCETVTFTVEPGDEVRFAVFARKLLPASACWQVCDGDTCSAPPSPCDTCNWAGPENVIPVGFSPLYTGRYRARAMRQTLRFPRAIHKNYLALCVTRVGLGESDSWIVQPAAWEGKSVVSVPYGGQKWPVWGSDAIDWSRWDRR